ncbi:MAG: SDR family NAD(P)-dependent oxidoreductase, partial [Stenotrophomonas maltophilia]
MANRDPLFDITGKTAIVTGASSGLGEVFSNIFAERGANLVLAARRTERLEEVAGKIIQGGGNAIAVSCDVGDAAQVKQMVATAAEHFGRVDILVNNAGQVADGGPVPER